MQIFDQWQVAAQARDIATVNRVLPQLQALMHRIELLPVRHGPLQEALN